MLAPLWEPAPNFNGTMMDCMIVPVIHLICSKSVIHPSLVCGVQCLLTSVVTSPPLWHDSIPDSAMNVLWLLRSEGKWPASPASRHLESQCQLWPLAFASAMSKKGMCLPRAAHRPGSQHEEGTGAELSCRWLVLWVGHKPLHSKSWRSWGYNSRFWWTQIL